jgi:hypothetical protein
MAAGGMAVGGMVAGMAAGMAGTADADRWSAPPLDQQDGGTIHMTATTVGLDPTPAADWVRISLGD